MVSATSKKGKDAEIKWSGKLCQECGFPVISDLVEVAWRDPEWMERKHKCEFIPPEILKLLDLNSAKKMAKEFVNKYRINSDNKIMMVTTPKIVDSFMRNLSKSFDILDEKFISWYNSGFPETGRVYDRSLDHYQLVKLAGDIVKEKLCTS